MSFVKLLIDSLPSENVIDLYFIMSDLKDILFKPGELEAMAANDALCKERYNQVLKSGWEYDKSSRMWSGPDGQKVHNGKMVF